VERGEREEQRDAGEEQATGAPDPGQCPPGAGAHQAVGRRGGEGRDRELEGEKGRGELEELKPQRAVGPEELRKHRAEEDQRLRVGPDEEEPARQRPGPRTLRRWW